MSALVLSSVLTLTVVGCGDEESTDPGVTAPVGTSPAETEPTDEPEATASPTATDAAGAPIELVETSYDISLADTAGHEEPLTVSVPGPGTYTFRVTNDSDIVHALEVEGHGIEAVTGDIQPGATATLEVDLREAGEYELYCPVGNHKSLGMDGSVVVQGG